MLESQAIVGRPNRSSRVRLPAKLGDCLDERRHPECRYRELVISYADDLGGADKLTEVERALIAQAATFQIQSERVQAAVLRGEVVNVEQLTRLANASMRILTRLGLKRERRDLTPSLDEYLAANRGEAAA